MGYKYLADQNQLVFIYESGTYSVGSGTRQSIGLVQDHTPGEDAGVVSVRYQGSFDRNVDTFTDGPLNYTGTFTYYPQDWKFLGFAIGSIWESAGSHIITEANSNIANKAVSTQSLYSFNLEDSKRTPTAGSNFIRTLQGCMIDTLTMNMTQGEILSCDVDYRAQAVTFSSGTVTAVTPSTTRPYLWSDVAVQIPSGTQLSNVSDFSLTINNNLEVRFPLNGSRYIEVPYPLNRDYEVAATFIMDATNAKTLYDQYFIGGSEFNSMVKIMGTPGSAFIIMSGCRVTDMSTPSPVEGIIEQTCTIVPQHINVNTFDSAGSYNAW